MHINIIYADEKNFPTLTRSHTEPNNFSLSNVRKTFGGPYTTIYNIVDGFCQLGLNISINDRNTELFDINLMLYLPGHNWRSSWCKKFLLANNRDINRFYLHPLVEVRQILEQLQEDKDTNAINNLIFNCNRACFLAESPKQYFRLLKFKGKLVKRIELAPVGFSSKLVPSEPYWKRGKTTVLIKDHNSYDVEVRSQHLCDMLDDYQIPYQKFNRYGSVTFEYKQWIQHLNKSKMLIAWDVEETHGHTLHEAKALDVPIFTTTPNGMNYFSSECGVVTNENELYSGFEDFIKKINQRAFSPRQWMLDNEMDNISSCKNLINLFNNKPSRYNKWLNGVTIGNSENS